MRHLVIPTVNVFIIKGSRLLLSRRLNTGWMDGFLCPPGGHVETRETPRLAIIREIKEELGAIVRVEDLEFACVVVRGTLDREQVAYEFIIRDKDYLFTNTEPEKCSELVWVELDSLPDDLIEQFKEVIIHGIVEGQPYIEVGY